MTSLEVSHLSVSFGSRVVINDLSFSLKEGEIASLLGPSGCGKTTLLRAVAGLLQPSQGTIRLGSQLVGLSSVVLPPHKRRTGYVPQQGALFPHLNVAKNIAFGLDKKELSSTQIKHITSEMLELIGMSGYESRMPTELSGGQQTRVALARALAIKPKMVLLDEPFSALDAELRNELRSEVVALLRAQGTTAILVTHDREEALVSSDKVVLIRDGKVAQFGSPEEVYESPVSPSAAVSTGDALILSAQQFADGRTAYSISSSGLSSGLSSEKRQDGYVVIRPEEIVVSKNSGNGVNGNLIQLDYYGHDAMLIVKLLDHPEIIRARVVGPMDFEVGDAVSVEHHGPIRFFAHQ
jgi:iron(III) transport system ATP-binding protein